MVTKWPLIFITVLCFLLPVEKESGSRLENHGGTEHNSKLPSKLQSHRTYHLRTDIRFSQTVEGHEASFLYFCSALYAYTQNITQILYFI